MPTRAMTHIQNTAPGPPSVIATATPAMLPPPTRPPTLTSNAARELTCPTASLLPSVSTPNIRLKYSTCTNPDVSV